MFVLDTNTLIYFFRGQGQVAANMSAMSAEELCIPTVVIYELQVGIAKSTSPERRTRELEILLTKINIVTFDRKSATAAAKIRAELEQAGTPIGPMDVLIAGTAVSLRATLVTHNVAEFSRVPGLVVADWF